MINRDYYIKRSEAILVVAIIALIVMLSFSCTVTKEKKKTISLTFKNKKPCVAEK